MLATGERFLGKSCVFVKPADRVEKRKALRHTYIQVDLLILWS